MNNNSNNNYNNNNNNNNKNNKKQVPTFLKEIYSCNTSDRSPRGKKQSTVIAKIPTLAFAGIIDSPHFYVSVT